MHIIMHIILYIMYIIHWINDDFGLERLFFTKITYVKVYGTFEEYLNDKGLENCLPGIPNLQ